MLTFEAFICLQYLAFQLFQKLLAFQTVKVHYHSHVIITCHYCCAFQAWIVLQRRHLPDRPQEYLLKLRCELPGSGTVKYRERWFPADLLCREYTHGAILIKQFEESKVGQLAVDTYLSKRRSLPSPKMSSDEPNRHATSTTDGQHQSKNLHSNGSESRKRKGCDLDRRHSSSNCFDSASSESLKSSCVVNNSTDKSVNSTTNKSFVQKSFSYHGNTYEQVARHKNFAKRLLLSDRVPQRNWSKNAAKDLKLPDLLQCKPTNQKSAVVSCKCEDNDSDADVRYSLATDQSDSSSAEKKRKKLTLVNGVKKEKDNVMESKRPKVVAADAEIKFKASPVLAAQTNCKAGIVTGGLKALLFLCGIFSWTLVLVFVDAYCGSLFHPSGLCDCCFGDSRRGISQKVTSAEGPSLEVTTKIWTGYGKM